LGAAKTDPAKDIFIESPEFVSNVQFETYGVFTPLSFASIEAKLPSSPKRGLPPQFPSQE
jgi:hypothetical protein